VYPSRFFSGSVSQDRGGRPGRRQLGAIDEGDLAALAQCHQRGVIEQIVIAGARLAMRDDTVMRFVERSP